MDNLDVRIDFLDFPPAHTCEGGNISPRITIAGLEASSIAIMVFNPSKRGVFSYCAWLIWDMNDAGEIGYTGPCPLPGENHRYLFRIWGLDDFLEISAGANKNQLTAAMHDHIVQYGETEAVATGKVA